MKLVKILSLATALLGVVALAIVVAPSVYGQSPRPDRDRDAWRFSVFGGRGSHIGASVRDLEGPDARQGVYVEDVGPDSPAAKAGLKPADIITKFDGEAVRSARQFGRLVQETPDGRTVAATIMRDGRATELSITPEEGPGFIDGDRLRAEIDGLDRLVGRMPFSFDFDFDLPGLQFPSRSGVTLGVTIDELTPQLASYFGAKDGVLVTSVRDDSPASRAGLKAGDVIASLNGTSVASRSDLLRALRDAGTDAEVTIGIVRDKKESSVKARLDDIRARRPQRPVRRVRTTPA